MSNMWRLRSLSAIPLWKVYIRETNRCWWTALNSTVIFDSVLLSLSLSMTWAKSKYLCWANQQVHESPRIWCAEWCVLRVDGQKGFFCLRPAHFRRKNIVKNWDDLGYHTHTPHLSGLQRFPNFMVVVGGGNGDTREEKGPLGTVTVEADWWISLRSDRKRKTLQIFNTFVRANLDSILCPQAFSIAFSISNTETPTPRPRL